MDLALGAAGDDGGDGGNGGGGILYLFIYVCVCVCMCNARSVNGQNVVIRWTYHRSPHFLFAERETEISPELK